MRKSAFSNRFLFLVLALLPFIKLVWTDDATISICEGLPPAPTTSRIEKLTCYVCNATSKDPDAKCDQNLFKYLRHSEKLKLRGPCPRDSVQFCMKRVKRKRGERKTERSCVSQFKVPTAGQYRNFKKYTGDGCYTYKENDYLVTSCFCQTASCNAAPSPSNSRFVFKMAAFLLLLVLNKWIVIVE